jgi:hypothetical protein
LQEKILTKPNFYPFPVFRLFSLFWNKKQKETHETILLCACVCPSVCVSPHYILRLMDHLAVYPPPLILSFSMQSVSPQRKVGA